MRTIFIFREWSGTVRGVGLALLVAGLLGAGVSRAQEAPPAAPALEAPKLKESAEATYPPQALEERLEAKVVLRLTLDAEGQVTQAEVVGPAGHGFDEAASEAALRMRFEPARRNGTPMPSRILYTYEFQPPPEPTPPAPPPPPTGSDEPIEVTVQGPSEGERRRRSAESVQVIDTENIQREAADLGEALSRTEGVNVRRSGGLGSRARFSLAGLTDEQIRFFVDGVPLELAGYGPELANVPVNLVQRVEIYQGVVPIRFGSDALGGAVQLVTDQVVRGTGVAASYELGSYDTHRLTLSARHLHEPSGLFLRANAFLDRTRNDYPVTAEVTDSLGRPQPRQVYRFHDDYGAAGASVEAGFADKPWARRLMLRAFVNGNGKDLQSSISMKVPYGDVTSGEDSLGSTLRYEQVFSGGFSADAIAGYVFRRTQLDDLGTCFYDWLGSCIKERPQPGELLFRPIERRVNQHTGFARLTFGWTPSAAHTLRLSLAPTSVSRTGEDLQLRALGQVDPLTADRNLLSLVSGLEYTLGALDDRLENIFFIKDYVQVADAQRLMPDDSFVPIGRSMHGVGVGDGVRLRLRRELSAKASYEYATRQPRPDEIFGDGVLIADNLDLNPERSHNFNLELAWDAPNTNAGAFRASVVGFGRLADQLIVLVGRESYFTYQNVFSARSLGAAGSAGWTSPGQYLTLDGNVTWQDFRNTSSEGAFGGFTGLRIPNRPYLQANGTARLLASGLMNARDELSLTWHVRYVHTFSRAWEGVGVQNPKMQVPSQFLQSLALSYVTRAWDWTMGWTVDVQNLTDTPAYDFYGVQRPGRSIFAKLTVEH